MAFDIQKLINSSQGINLVSVVGRVFPRSLGIVIANFAAAKIASQRNSSVVQAVRANQWVIRGESPDRTLLEKAVHEAFENSAQSLFDLYHFINDPKAVSRMIELDTAASQLIKRPEFNDRGLVIAGLHISSFDLILQWMCLQGMKPMVLTIPNPQGGRQMEYEMRKKTGMNLVPTSLTALRQAVRHLEMGGVVLTGIDRPISDPETRPCFFGRPANLPIHHIFLAIKARVPVQIIAVNRQNNGKYHVQTSEIIEMDVLSNRELQIKQNAEKVLTIAESFIRQTPAQWSMSLPVWPETLHLMPQ